jgi:hypothetical protein
VQIKAVLLCNRYLENLRSIESGGPHLMPRSDTTDEDPAVRPGRRSLLEPYPRVSSGPLAELGLADVVDVNPDTADVALVNLDLVQIRGGVGAAPR